MKYDAKTPEEYISLLKDDWRKEKLLEVKRIILNASGLNEGMSYNMLSYGMEEYIIFHLNAQKSHVSLYIGDINKVPYFRKMLEPFDIGKGCIRIKKKVIIKETQLEDFIKTVIEIWRKGRIQIT